MTVRRAGIATVCAAALCLIAACSVTTSKFASKDAQPEDGLPKGRMISVVAARAQSAPIELSPDEMKLIRPHLLDGPGLLHIPNFELYLNGILAKLAAQLPVKSPVSKVYISPLKVFNGEGGAEGGIVLTVGVISSLQSEDEIAFVIGHELAHIALGHQRDRAQTETLVYSAEALAEVGIMLSRGSSGGNSTGSQILHDPTVKSLLLSKGGAMLARDVLFPSWSRDQEQEADLLAIDMMIAAGYSTAGISTVYERLENEDAQDEKQRADEAAAAKAAQAQQNDAAIKNGQFADAMVKSLISEIVRSGASLDKDMANRHGLAEKRHDIATAYLHREYPGPGGDVNSVALTKALTNKDTAARLKAFDLLAEADAAFAQDKPQEATALLQKIPKGPMQSESYYLYLESQRLAAAGKTKEAIAALGRSISPPDAPLRNFIKLIELQLRSGHEKDAAETYQTASLRFEKPRELLPLGIKVLKKANRKGDAAALEVECLGVGIEDIRQQCGFEAKN